ncbi:MAG: nitroreductase family deazaflavin-dependent oxidoreductase [Gammaproteobacteria bacterium]|nr:nitroreductase family deazaflavin-dependent oxidoreductase [Gammaproteobacteria bacterium]
MTQIAVRQHDWQRSFQSFPASPRGAAALAKVLHHVDRVLMAATRQHWSIPRAVVGLPVVGLSMVGARSSEHRKVPLIGIQDGDDIVVLAANWGRTTHPGWLFNVRANPEVELDFYGVHGRYHATEVALGEEHNRLWRKALSIYPGFENYRDRAGERGIPIIVFQLDAST